MVLDLHIVYLESRGIVNKVSVNDRIGVLYVMYVLINWGKMDCLWSRINVKIDRMGADIMLIILHLKCNENQEESGCPGNQELIY